MSSALIIIRFHILTYLYSLLLFRLSPLNLPRLKGQEGKPMIKEGRIMGARSVFTKEFKECAVEPARNTNRKHSEIA
jgi:hypothetical protein